jgi:peptidyl-tRNA hydrolase
MKMYIIVRDFVPVKFVPVITAHASLACYLRYKDNVEMHQWINSTFKKVVCKVNSTEFENAKKEENFVLLTESALENMEVCLAFCPRNEYSKQFKYFKMWTP